jgi:hypothetical protein
MPANGHIPRVQSVHPLAERQLMSTPERIKRDEGNIDGSMEED